jgi:hypothetical protein
VNIMFHGLINPCIHLMESHQLYNDLERSFVLRCFGISTNDEELDLSSLYGYLKYIHVLTNSVMLLCLPNAPRNFSPNHYTIDAFLLITFGKQLN